jgi:putative PIN family toxin of toxin-antitoxin system
MRIVIDTNVWISGLLWRGPAWALLKLAEAGHVQVCTTPLMLEELAEVLSYKQFQPRLAQLGLSPAELLSYVIEQTTVIEAKLLEGDPIVVADPDDDVFLLCASVAQAAYIVSGDAHLLALGEYAGAPILSIREFLAREFPDQPLP